MSEIIFGNVNKNMRDLRKRLIELRKENNLSQEYLADDLNIPRSTVASWEAGSRLPKISQLNLISEYYDVTVDYLLGLVEGKNEYMRNEELKDI